MKHFKILIFFLFFISCRNSSSKGDQQISNSDAHSQEAEADKAFSEFQKVLDSLYSISDTNPKNALLLADKYLNRYKDTIKSRGFSVNEIEDLHYLKGEIFYNLKKFKNSLDEFRYTRVDGNLAIASNFMKLKLYDSAYGILSKVVPGYYLYDYVWANYYELMGKRDSAIRLYKNILAEDYINNGNYETLKNNTKKRLDMILSSKEPLTDLYFKTNNPKFRNKY